VQAAPAGAGVGVVSGLAQPGNGVIAGRRQRAAIVRAAGYKSRRGAAVAGSPLLGVPVAR
jgi:hypothetical protein